MFVARTEEAPFAGGGVEALLADGDQMVGVDGLHVHRHLLDPLLQRKAAAGAAHTRNACYPRVPLSDLSTRLQFNASQTPSTKVKSMAH